MLHDLCPQYSDTIDETSSNFVGSATVPTVSDVGDDPIAAGTMARHRCACYELRVCVVLVLDAVAFISNSSRRTRARAIGANFIC
jgi:hypothetical protein